MKIEDELTVTFDKDYEAGICVSRVANGKVVVLKIEVGEQADILYHLLTEQTAKAEIKTESEEVGSLSNIDGTFIISGGEMVESEE